MAFGKRQVEMFVRQVQEETGNGWALIGPRLQEALLCEKALAVICTQATNIISVDTITELRASMLRYAGLLE